MDKAIRPRRLEKFYRTDSKAGILPSHANKLLKISRPSLSMILNGRGGVSLEMSLKLDDVFGTSEGFWFRLQNNYDLASTRKGKRKILPVAASHRLATSSTA